MNLCLTSGPHACAKACERQQAQLSASYPERGDPVALEELPGTLPEAGGGVRFLVGEDLRVVQLGIIIHCVIGGRRSGASGWFQCWFYRFPADQPTILWPPPLGMRPSLLMFT